MELNNSQHTQEIKFCNYHQTYLFVDNIKYALKTKNKDSNTYKCTYDKCNASFKIIAGKIAFNPAPHKRHDPMTDCGVDCTIRVLGLRDEVEHNRMSVQEVKQKYNQNYEISILLRRLMKFL